MESLKRKIYKFNPNFFQSTTVQEHNCCPKYDTERIFLGLFKINFCSYKNSGKPSTCTNISDCNGTQFRLHQYFQYSLRQYFHSIFCAKGCWKGHKFQVKVAFISKNFMNKLLFSYILCLFVQKFILQFFLNS